MTNNENHNYIKPLGGKHRLIQGDATIRQSLSEDSIDLTVTSPPYNVGKSYSGNAEDDSIDYKDYLEFSKKWLLNCYYWTKNTGRLCLNVAIDKSKNGRRPLSVDITQIALKCGWNYHATIFWNKNHITRRTAWGSWKSASAPCVSNPAEAIIILYKGEWKRERQGKSDITSEEFKNWVLGIWSFRGENGRRIGHEAPFPRELPKRCIKLFSFVGDTVLDPFAGSGTTLLEAIANGRIAQGIELERDYCQLAFSRLEKESGVDN